MKNMFFLCLLLISSVAHGADYFVYEKPDFMSDAAAAAAMAAENSLGTDDLNISGIILPDGRLASDFSYDTDQENDLPDTPEFMGIIGIKNSMAVQDVFLTAGVTDVRLSPPENLVHDVEKVVRDCIVRRNRECGHNTDAEWREKCTVSARNKNPDGQVCLSLSECVARNIDAWCRTLAQPDCPLKYKKCDGHVIGSFERGRLVLARLQYGEWLFVSDGKNGGWVARTDLKDIPAGKIYISREIQNPSDYFKDKADEYQTSASLQILQLAVENKTYAPSDPGLEKFCPGNISALEEDGFVSNAWPPDLSAKKYELSLLCRGRRRPPEYEKIDHVSMKTEKCSCYEGSSFEEYVPKEMMREEVFSFEDNGKKEFRCELRKHHVVCYTQNPCHTEGCGFWPVEKVCPTGCLSWRPKSGDTEKQL